MIPVLEHFIPCDYLGSYIVYSTVEDIMKLRPPAPRGLRFPPVEEIEAVGPDLCLYWPPERTIVLIDFVPGRGPIDEWRAYNLAQGFDKLRLALRYVTVFKDRAAFGRMVDRIADGTTVWVADDKYLRIEFNARPIPEYLRENASQSEPE